MGIFARLKIMTNSALVLVPAQPQKTHRYSGVVVALHPEYIDLTGDLTAAYLLSQIVFWYQRDKQGKPQIDCYLEGNYWIDRTYNEWATDLHLSAKQVRTAMDKLRKQGLVICSLIQDCRTTKNYYRLACANGQACLLGHIPQIGRAHV